MKFNPFSPNQPIYTGVFAGRSDEIELIDKSLFQTKNSNPSHVMLVGERGIGKTSLLLLAKNFARGQISFDGPKYDFLTVQVSLTDKTTLIDLALSIKARLKREIDSINPQITLIKKCWEFISKFEVMGVAYKGSTSIINESQLFDELTFSLVDTVKNLTEHSLAQEIGLSHEKDGLVLLIDEADKANNDLDLGVFLKTLSESLVANGCNKILIILAGLPNLIDVLRNSHESSIGTSAFTGGVLDL